MAAAFFTSQHSSVSWVEACDGIDNERESFKDEGKGLGFFRTLLKNIYIFKEISFFIYIYHG